MVKKYINVRCITIKTFTHSTPLSPARPAVLSVRPKTPLPNGAPCHRRYHRLGLMCSAAACTAGHPSADHRSAGKARVFEREQQSPSSGDQIVLRSCRGRPRARVQRPRARGRGRWRRRRQRRRGSIRAE
jgi:hypothetical protein